jgi:hypothetical protein
MKRTKVIALVLCAAIMMMGAGYAYWTETITFNATVETGFLDVDCENEDTATFSDVEGTIEDDVVATSSISPKHPDGISTGIANDDDPARTITFSNLYPDCKAVASFDLINNSTIPVKMFEPLFYLVGDQQELVSSSLIDVYVLIEDEEGNVGEYELTALEAPIDLTLPRNDTDAITNSLETGEEFKVQIVVEVLPTLEVGEDVDDITIQFSPEFRQFNDDRTE